MLKKQSIGVSIITAPHALSLHTLHAAYVATLLAQQQIAELHATSVANESEMKNTATRLAEATKQFKKILRQHPDYPKIKTYAKYYRYIDAQTHRQESPQSPFSKIKLLFKKFLQSNPVALYEDYLTFRSSALCKSILLQHYYLLTDIEQKIFLEQFLLQSNRIKEAIFAAQGINDLSSLRATFSKLQLDKWRYKTKEYQADLLEGIKNFAVDSAKCKELLAIQYLKKHRDELAAITGTTHNDLNSLAISPVNNAVYQIHILTTQGEFNPCPYLLSRREVLDLASRELVQQHTATLKELLFASISDSASHDTFYPDTRQQA